MIATAVKTNLGVHLLHWAITHSDFWQLANRCSQLVQKINDPLEKSAYVLDNLLTMDEDDIDVHCVALRDLNLHRMHFEDEDDYNDQADRRFDDADQGNHFRNRPQRFAGKNALRTCARASLSLWRAGHCSRSKIKSTSKFWFLSLCGAKNMTTKKSIELVLIKRPRFARLPRQIFVLASSSSINTNRQLLRAKASRSLH